MAFPRVSSIGTGMKCLIAAAVITLVMDGLIHIPYASIWHGLMGGLAAMAHGLRQWVGLGRAFWYPVGITTLGLLCFAFKQAATHKKNDAMFGRVLALSALAGWGVDLLILGGVCLAHEEMGGGMAIGLVIVWVVVMAIVMSPMTDAEESKKAEATPSETPAS